MKVFGSCLFNVTDSILKSVHDVVLTGAMTDTFVHTEITIRSTLLNQLLMSLHTGKNVVVHPFSSFLMRPFTAFTVA